LLSQIKTTENQICSWISVSSDELQAEGFDKTAVTGLSDFFASICTTDVTILFYELEDGTSKASLKSKKTDVKTLAAQLGGGGHANASGINKQEPLDEFTTEVLALFTQITVNYKLST
jgi:phosphoesterase RecJ-like protein